MKSSKDAAWPGQRQPLLNEETPTDMGGDDRQFTAADIHNPHVIEFYLVAQEARLREWYSPKITLTITCGLASTTFIRTVNGIDEPGPPHILPLRAGKDANGVPWDYYEMINPQTTYTIDQFNVTNPARGSNPGCPLEKLEIVPTSLPGASATDYQNNDGTDSVEIITSVYDRYITMRIPNITAHTHFFHFRIKATAAGGRVEYTDNIKIKKIYCDLAPVTQDPNWPTLVQKYEEKQPFKYTKNIQYDRNVTIEWPQAFILNVPECPVNHFEVHYVQHAKYGINLSNFGSVVWIDDKGNLTFNDLYNVRDLHNIHIRASAGNEGRVWSDDTVHLATIEITEIPYVVNQPPYFKAPLTPQILHFDETDFERIYQFPNMTDPEGKPVTITILNIDEKFMTLDNDTRTIRFTPQNDP